MHVRGLPPKCWFLYFKNKIREMVFRFFFVQVGNAHLFWSIFAYLFFFTDRERMFVAKALETSLLKTHAIVKRHPHKYNIIYEEWFGDSRRGPRPKVHGRCA